MSVRLADFFVEDTVSGCTKVGLLVVVVVVDDVLVADVILVDGIFV